MSLPPGPSAPAIVQTLRVARDFEGTMAQCIRRYGSTYTLRILGMGELVYVTDPELIKQVFTGDPDCSTPARRTRCSSPSSARNSCCCSTAAAPAPRRLMLPAVPRRAHAALRAS